MGRVFASDGENRERTRAGNGERAAAAVPLPDAWLGYEISFIGWPQQLPGRSATCPHFSQRY